MAHSLQAKKRIRQNKKHQLHNKSIKTEIKTLTKKLVNLVEKKDRDAAVSLFPTVISKMDKAARKRVYHPGTIARKKSRVTKILNSLEGGAEQESP
jgi:small subunit ribosomal protein S20